VWPAGERDEYFPLVLAEQFASRSDRLPFGYDGFSDPGRREAMLRALQGRTPAYTQLLHLKVGGGIAGGAGETVEPAILAYQPILRSGAGADDLVGFVVLSVRPTVLLSRLTANLQGVRVDWRQTTEPVGAAPIPVTDERRIVLNRGGRVWQFRVRAVGTEVPWISSRVALALLGIAIGMAALLLRRARQVEHRRRTAEARLAAEENVAEARFRELAAGSPIPLWQADAEFRIRFMSPGWEDLLHLRGVQVNDLAWLDVLHPEDRRRVHAGMAELIRKPRSYKVRARYGAGGDRYRWAVVLGVPRYGPDKRLEGWTGCLLDIDRHVVTEQRLRLSEARNRAALAASDLALWEWDVEEDRLTLSDSADVMLDPALWRDAIRRAETGQPRSGSRPNDDLRFRDSRGLRAIMPRWHPDDLPSLHEALDTRLTQDDEIFLESRLEVRTGEFRWFEVRASVQRDERGRSIRMLGSLQGVEERKRLEVERVQQRQFLDAVLGAVPVGVVVKDRSGRWVIVNEEMARLLGRPVAELTGRTDADLFPEDLAARYRQQDLALLDSGGFRTEEERQETTSGMRWLLKNRRVLRTADDEAVLIVCALDITARKEAEDALEDNRHLLHAVLEAMPTPVVVKNERHEWIFINRANNELNGWTPGEMLGKTDGEVHPPERARRNLAEDDRVLAADGPLVFEDDYELDDGRIRRLHKTKTAITLRDGRRLVISVNFDVTERWEAELALQRNKAFLDTVLDLVPVAVVAKDREQRWMVANRAATRMHGVEREQVIGRTDWDLFAPEQAAILKEQDDALLASGG
ncbi:MAG: PAS domain S-box protein, partial [Burkholderiales bacterium]|nr:PAS domain S-box protein [Burkholderiales bacterium]